MGKRNKVKISTQNEAKGHMSESGFKIPDFDGFCAIIKDIFESTYANTDGAVADYIPQLKRVDPEKFAMSICTIEGKQYSLGDFDDSYCVQSTCKPINYCLAISEHSVNYVHKHVGCEPSGENFNALTLNRSGLPHNPMINSGAIMCCALIKPELNLADRFEHILDTWSKMNGGKKPGFNNSVYVSEKGSADRNFALGYFMKENGAFPDNVRLKETLDFYFQCCSIETTVKDQAVVAATLANSGRCPLTAEKVFKSATVKNCLSLMFSCGMYNFSGEFAFTVGLPAKSGVSGTLMIVVPGLMGITIWSPRLDALGNSVRGIEVSRKLVERFNINLFDRNYKQLFK